MAQYLDNDTGSLFIQPDGVGPTDLQWLGCHDLGDVEKPMGDIERSYCPDPTGRGKWLVATRTQGPPGEVTFDVELAVGQIADYLEISERKHCAIPIYAVYNSCVARDQFGPFWRAMIINGAIVTSVTANAPVMRNADGSAPTQITETFSFSALDWYWAFELGWLRRVTTEAENLLDIAICSDPACAGICGGSVDFCDELVAGAAGGVAAANFLYSNNEGITWTAAAADPFAVAEDISTVGCFELDDGTTRWIAVRGTTDGGNPAEIGYSDDAGATWTNVNVGATNAEFAPWNGCLFVLDPRHIWIATDTGAGAAGEIYFSSDFGATWTAQGAGAGDALNCVRFVDARVGLAVGDTNEVLRTLDGGAHWVAMTGPAAQAAADALTCVIFNQNRWYIGYDDGEIWFTDDAGANWTQCPNVAVPGYTLTHCNDLGAVDENTIWAAMCFNSGADEYAVLARTITGGEQWEYWLADTACDAGVGMGAVAVCNANRAFGVGCVETTGWIMEVAES